MLAPQMSLFAPERRQNLSIAGALEQFTFNGKPTAIEWRDGIRYFVNEFWTAKQRQAHRLHEISYRACFKPQLPEFFISRLTSPGDAVYDPFMGRGTTPLQAALMGRNAVGNDINPLSVMLVRPRISPPRIQSIAARLSEISWQSAVETDDRLLVFYHPETLREICALREWLMERERNGSFDEVDDWIRMVAINRLSGHSPGFFSVYSLPPNQAVSIESQRRINEKRNQTPPRRSVPALILEKSRKLLCDGHPPKTALASFHISSADNTVEIPDESADLVVTSPPFLDIVQYASDNWLRCWFAGIDTQNVSISMYKQPDDWANFIRRVFKELARIVRRGGYVAFEVGEVRNGKVELEQLVLNALRGLPFMPLAVLVNDQEFTKTAKCWGVNNNAKGTNTNRIVLSRRV